MTHIRMKLTHLCLCGMLCIIHSKITWISRIYFATLVMFCDVGHFFPFFVRGAFPKIARKSPARAYHMKLF